MYSDNSGIIISADKVFLEINWAEISAVTVVQNMRWKFNPPTTAWWGSWREQLIQMVKNILRKLSRASLFYEELILCDCEQVVKARMWCYWRCERSIIVNTIKVLRWNKIFRYDKFWCNGRDNNQIIENYRPVFESTFENVFVLNIWDNSVNKVP